MKISISSILISVICIGIGCLLLAGTWASYSEYSRLQNYSGTASGRITKKHFQTTADGGANYYLDYWFLSAAGHKISVSSIISKPQWDMLQVNDLLEIRYDKSDPNRNLPMHGGSPSLIFAFFMLVMGAVFVIFGGSRLFYSFHKPKARS